MDMETLFAFAATFPKEFAQMMDACAEHIELAADPWHGDGLLCVEYRVPGNSHWQHFVASVY